MGFVKDLLKILACILLVIGLLSYGFIKYQDAQHCTSTREDVVIESASKTLSVELANTQESRGQGLSDRECLAENSGMLFEFDSSAPHCFWMKDMNFSLDIIWLDENKQVVDYQQSATPESYPEAFCPDELAKYVIEVNSGYVDTHNIEVGQELNW